MSKRKVFTPVKRKKANPTTKPNRIFLAVKRQADKGFDVGSVVITGKQKRRCGKPSITQLAELDVLAKEFSKRDLPNNGFCPKSFKKYKKLAIVKSKEDKCIACVSTPKKQKRKYEDYKVHYFN